MNQLGMGVMINMLGGNEETYQAIQTSMGKCINLIFVKNDELHIRFIDDTAIKLYDAGQSCCESRYMNTDDDLDYYSGATLTDFELADGPSEGDDCVVDSQFLKVNTSKGTFTVVNYNDHNGYYGGFAIEARTYDP